MYRSLSQLPEPSADARAHSERVSDLLRAQIAEAHGFLPFRDWMNTALYAPGLGYYTAGARKFGADGDFITAPELTPLFGRTLATDVAAILAASDKRHILELGAGSGKLARDILAGLDAMGAKVERYDILDVSADLVDRQRATVGNDARVHWLTELPERIDGAIVMNEVLDALPVDIVSRRNGEWFERGVAVHEGRFVWAESPIEDDELRAMAEMRFPAHIDYYSEINRNAERLVGELARRMQSGAMLIVDYGYPAHEFYHPQRSEGTLMAHYRHRATPDPFVWPGLSDITSHVDFSAVANAIEANGANVAGYVAQATYLISAGILERLAEAGEPTGETYIRQSAGAQHLISPTEMGERFKVMAIASRGAIEWKGFALRNDAARIAP
ncbi:MAG: SAM-dependent methyltransferase [Proteobacteria bacterium]|nr:SAM-dependent methyltransferase [Pseudomonadota bacterium]